MPPRQSDKIGKTPLRTDAPDLEAPLDPSLQYFDATPSIETIAEELRLMTNRMVQLEKLFELQSSINGQLLENMNNLLLRQAELDNQPKKSAIILPDRLNS